MIEINLDMDVNQFPYEVPLFFPNQVDRNKIVIGVRLRSVHNTEIVGRYNLGNIILIIGTCRDI